MDLTNPNKYFEAPPPFASHGEAKLEGKAGFYKTNIENPFVGTFADPLCKLNLKETSDFVKAFPMPNNGNFLEISAQRRSEEGASSVARRSVNVEAPPTPGRPMFSFSVGNLSRKNFPSKWDDAEKWLISGNDSPAHHHGFKGYKQGVIGLKPQEAAEVYAEKSRVTEERVSKAISTFQGAVVSLDHHSTVKAFNGVSASADVLLKDKYTNEVEPCFRQFRCLEPMKEGFLFGNSVEKSMKDAATNVVHEVKHRDIGTEMTPLGSSTTSRCHTPFISTSPARHNTPASRSGPLALTNSDSTNSTIDIAQLQECHLAKLQLGTQFDSVTSNWSSREEEEEEISKSLRHFEMTNRKSVSESRACAWEEEEKTKSCLRYQREEAKIQAWVNLQNAKAEAQSKKLEVKIQKMRSNLEEKLMKRMATVHRKAEELRAAAQIRHSEQIQRAEQERKTMDHRQNLHFQGRGSCGCFPCNNHHL
ncbi:hypothetical protein RJ639_043925 [Escallonia herrerae]|uniref:Remorin C-terminal domain-containing protein n=1 Tax=Escallonia herrerae TaxID=1293975 RepID=A0AA88WE01_9ASTE|nr:hypothetical protein RJ639_043925 [Escallonia herrerae]